MDASDSFLKAKSFSNQESKEDNARVLMNLSLIRIANGMYNEAYDSLIEANNLIPNNPTVIYYLKLYVAIEQIHLYLIFLDY